MKIKKFVKIAAFLNKETIESIREMDVPSKLCGKVVPPDLDSVTFGQLLQLQSIKSEQDLLFMPGMILLGAKKKKLFKEDVEILLRFSIFVQEELQRIATIFQSIECSKTSEEIRAGIESLNFGAFGMIDWYAKRMGIMDHAEVESVPWVRIYQCMNIDSQRMEYEKRLRFECSKKS